MDNINKEYYVEMHNKKKFKGWSSNTKTNYSDNHLFKIHGALKATRSKTILDFGCGTAEQYTVGNVHKKMGVNLKDILLYDIGVKKYSQLPEKYTDATISFDVLEHIPREELPKVLEYIFEYTNNFCYFVIFCGLAQKVLPNGENAHCTIMEPKSWKQYINQYNKKNIPVLYSFKIPTDPKFNILNL